MSHGLIVAAAITASLSITSQGLAARCVADTTPTRLLASRSKSHPPKEGALRKRAAMSPERPIV
jgi:hypothetical protein